MKTTFKDGDVVQTPTSQGIVKGSIQFTDHTEYWIEYKDGTASYVHQDNLKLAGESKAPAAPGAPANN